MCGSSKLGYFIGNLIYIVEKLASCCAVTAVVTCLITTLILMLAFGIGLGYNYCFVDFKTKEDSSPARSTYTTSAGTTPIAPESSEIPYRISITKEESEISEETKTTKIFDEAKTTKDDFIIPPLKVRSSIMRRKMDYTKVTESVSPVIKRTMIVPLDVGVDLLSLLSKIRALNRNVTLEIIAP